MVGKYVIQILFEYDIVWNSRGEREEDFSPCRRINFVILGFSRKTISGRRISFVILVFNNTFTSGMSKVVVF